MNPNKHQGFHRGYVISLDDPTKTGRVQIRVPVIHGDSDDTPNDLLPWAEVESMGGGTQDCGSYEPPIKGSRVLVVFEMGHPDLPLVLSTFRAIPPNPVTVTPPGATLPIQTEAVNEIPVEVEGANDTKIIWHKSWKGNTVMCEELDDAEFIRVIDRAGNTVELKAPMPPGSARRGGGNAIDGGAQSPASMSSESHILLKDISGQEIRMVANPTPEITFTTTGRIKLGGSLASLSLAIAPLLYATLQTFIATVKLHFHNDPASGVTGPAQGIGDIADPSQWGSEKTVVEGL
jgi:hypothetical protein